MPSHKRKSIDGLKRLERGRLQMPAVVGKPEQLEMRNQRSAPVMARFHKWLNEQQGLHLPAH